MTDFQPYFLQTTEWASFWKQANGVDHTFFWLEVERGGFRLRTLVYEFPWHLGQHFWYVAKGGILTDADGQVNSWSKIDSKVLENLFIDLNKNLLTKAKLEGISFIKSDWEEGMAQRLGLNDNLSMEIFLKTNLDSKFHISKKIIQYLRTATLDLRPIRFIDLADMELGIDGKEADSVSLKIQKQKRLMELNTEKRKIEVSLDEQYNPEELIYLPTNQMVDFWDKSKNFWASTNENVRRYTKKSLSQGWQTSTQKNQTNFEAFWDVCNFTKDRHHFEIHPKEYYQAMFNRDFSRVIIIRDADGVAQGVWLGSMIGDTMTYLHGGNRPDSFAKWGQYLIHLVAIQMAQKEEILFYDLGGYDPSKGFGKFKENYRGQVRTFVGAFDVPVRSLAFVGTKFLIESTKQLVRLRSAVANLGKVSE